MNILKYHKFINSSVLHSAAWSEDFETLLIKFNSGAIWIYKEVPELIYNSLIKSSSAGNYFNSNIRNSYVSECMYKKGVEVG